jgi:hypothetical protein
MQIRLEQCSILRQSRVEKQEAASRTSKPPATQIWPRMRFRGTAVGAHAVAVNIANSTGRRLKSRDTLC